MIPPGFPDPHLIGLDEPLPGRIPRRRCRQLGREFQRAQRHREIERDRQRAQLVRVMRRGWPGKLGYQPPRVSAEPERLRDRLALILIALPELGALPERLGLAGALLIHGQLVLRRWIVHHDNLDVDARAQLEDWCHQHGYQALDASAFGREVLARWAYSGTYSCLVAGANLGRSLGLLAAWCRPAKRRAGFRDGWGLGLPGWGRVIDRDGRPDWSRDFGKPKVYLAKLGTQGVKIEFGPPRDFVDKKRGVRERRGVWNPDGSCYKGRFVDLVPAAFAFDDVDSVDLADHLPSWGIDCIETCAIHADADGAAHVAAWLEVQHGLALMLDDEAAVWGIDLRDLVSPGTLANLALTRMGVTATLVKFKISRREYDAWTHCLHGGWVTAEVIGQVVAAADLDVNSAYAVYAHHLGWWEYLTAARVTPKRRVREFRRFITQPNPVLRAAMKTGVPHAEWGFTRCKVDARGEPFPAEVVDEDNPTRTRLVLRPTWGEIDCTWLDVVAATVLADRPVDADQIHQVVQLVPDGRRDGLCGLDIPGGRLEPDHDPVLDLVPLRADYRARSTQSVVAYRRSNQLHAFTNALVYGNFARFDGAGNRQHPGPRCDPALAACVAAAVRCCVALAEADLRDRGAPVLYRDTDGLVVAAFSGLDEILASYDGLAIAGGRFWKVARGTGDKPLLFCSFGPKRWMRLHRDGEDRLLVDDATESIIGDYAAPPTMPGLRDDGRRQWWLETARVLAESAERADRSVAAFPWEYGSGAGFPALRRRCISTADELAALPAALGARPFTRIVEGVTARASQHARPVALDPGGDLADWQHALAFCDAHAGELIRATTNPDAIGVNGVILDELRGRAIAWRRSPTDFVPEVIELDQLLTVSVGRDPDAFSRYGGDQPVYASIDEAAVLSEIVRLVGWKRFAEITGLGPRTAQRFTTPGRHRPSTIRRALASLRDRGLGLAGALQLARTNPLACAAHACTDPVHRFGDRCPAHQRERDRLRKRRDRAALVRGVPCRCGTTVGFGDVQPGWRADCCPSGRRRDPVVDCPHCGALLLGDAIDAPDCLACGTALRAEEVGR